MSKSAYRAVSVVFAAGLIAGALTVIPGTSEKVEASAPLNSGKSDRLDVRAIGPSCSQQAWPYYEAGCLKDRRQGMGQAKATRIVTADRLGK